MLGSSRESLAAASEALDARRSAAGFDTLAAELFAVADLLGREKQLRTTLADSGQPLTVRKSLVDSLLGSRVAPLTLEVVNVVVDSRWSNENDLVEAVETLANQAAFTVAQNANTLDATEDEIFRFGRAVDASSDLQMALTDPAASVATKSAIVRDLLAHRATATTVQVLEFAAGHLHGRRLDAVVDALVEQAARQRDRLVAEVRVAAPLTDEQSRRLADLLGRLKGRTVRVNVAIDPSVLGGVYVKIGEEVIDGTVANRMEQARRAVIG